MKMTARGFRYLFLKKVALFAVCAVMALAPPAAYAHWNSVLTYAQGTFGVGGVFSTTGYDHRHFNRVWHQYGYTWCVWWHLTDGSNVAVTCDYVNPTEWPYEVGYAKAQCHNTNDNSGVKWTCQTTT
jgi:hypothetical protein